MKKYLYRDLYNLEERHWWHVSKRNAVTRLIEKYIGKKNLKILDVGCGSGMNLTALGKYGDAFGIDSSPEAIMFCKKRNLKNVKLGIAEKTGFAANSFDLITALDVIEHTKDDSKSLEELYRILKPGGYIIITVPAYEALWSQWDVVLQHYRRYSREGLIKLLKDKKFEILKLSYMYSFALLPVIVVRFFKNRLYKDNYPSDFSVTPDSANWLLKLVSKLELYLLLIWSIPFGTALITVAQKKD